MLETTDASPPQCPQSQWMGPATQLEVGGHLNLPSALASTSVLASPVLRMSASSGPSMKVTAVPSHPHQGASCPFLSAIVTQASPGIPGKAGASPKIPPYHLTGPARPNGPLASGLLLGSPLTPHDPSRYASQSLHPSPLLQPAPRIACPGGPPARGAQSTFVPQNPQLSSPALISQDSTVLVSQHSEPPSLTLPSSTKAQQSPSLAPSRAAQLTAQKYGLTSAGISKSPRLMGVKSPRGGGILPLPHGHPRSRMPQPSPRLMPSPAIPTRDLILSESAQSMGFNTSHIASISPQPSLVAPIPSSQPSLVAPITSTAVKGSMNSAACGQQDARELGPHSAFLGGIPPNRNGMISPGCLAERSLPCSPHLTYQMSPQLSSLSGAMSSLCDSGAIYPGENYKRRTKGVRGAPRLVVDNGELTERTPIAPQSSRSRGKVAARAMGGGLQGGPSLKKTLVRGAAAGTGHVRHSNPLNPRCEKCGGPSRVIGCSGTAHAGQQYKYQCKECQYAWKQLRPGVIKKKNLPPTSPPLVASPPQALSAMPGAAGVTGVTGAEGVIATAGAAEAAVAFPQPTAAPCPQDLQCVQVSYATQQQESVPHVHDVEVEVDAPMEDLPADRERPAAVPEAGAEDGADDMQASFTDTIENRSTTSLAPEAGAEESTTSPRHASMDTATATANPSVEDLEWSPCGNEQKADLVMGGPSASPVMWCNSTAFAAAACEPATMSGLEAN